MTETTEATARPGRKPAEKFDNCPLCGYKFGNPSARCGNRKACERRQAIKAAGGDINARPTVGGEKADPSKDAKKAGIEERAARRRAAAKGQGIPTGDKTAEVAAALNNPRPVLRIKLTSQGQNALADKLFPAEGPDAIRSGRAGSWLLVQEGERETVEARLVEARGTDPTPKAGTDAAMAKTIIEHAQEAEAKLAADATPAAAATEPEAPEAAQQA